MKCFRSTVSLGALALILTGSSAHAQWPAGGRALAIVTGDQSQLAGVSDGAGGMIVAWADFRSANYDIYAQHVAVGGALAPGWPANGFPICTFSGDQIAPVISSDGAGGAIIAWQDKRVESCSGFANIDVYAQHISGSATIASGWPLDGLAVAHSCNEDISLAIVEDGTGGAIIAWQQYSGTDWDIWAQRITGGGVVASGWSPNGVKPCGASGDQRTPKLVSDGGGGAIIVWQDQRPGTTNDIYAQHIQGSNGANASGWPANGVGICTAAGDQLHPAIAPDGAGGAVIAWYDARNLATTGYDIYAQRITGAGAIASGWSANGTLICNAAGDQTNPRILSDGAGGAWVAWWDHRGADDDLYAQAISGTGAVAWTANGAALFAVAGNQHVIGFTSDGAGGAVVAWTDGRLNALDGLDLYALRVASGGVAAPGWPLTGQAVCTAPGDPQTVAIAGDGANGAVLAWIDSRNTSTTGYDVYAQRVTGSGFVTGVDSPVSAAGLRMLAPRPNPARGSTAIAFELPEAERVSLEVLDLEGRVVRTLISMRALNAGQHSVSWDGRSDAGERAAAGIYFVRLRAGVHTVTQHLARMR